MPHGLISFNAAVEVTGDGKVGDVPLDGTVAPSAGVAYVYAPEREFSLIGEMFFGMERFEDVGSDIEKLSSDSYDGDDDSEEVEVEDDDE